MTGEALLVAMALFQVKHYLADFHWQTTWMISTKGNYGHMGGLAHAGLHGLLSLPVLGVAATWMPWVFVLLVLVEIVVHYHIDWNKARHIGGRGIDEDDPSFWRVLGLDQAAHHLTYIAMLAALLVIA